MMTTMHCVEEESVSGTCGRRRHASNRFVATLLPLNNRTNQQSCANCKLHSKKLALEPLEVGKACPATGRFFLACLNQSCSTSNTLYWLPTRHPLVKSILIDPHLTFILPTGISLVVIKMTGETPEVRSNKRKKRRKRRQRRSRRSKINSKNRRCSQDVPMMSARCPEDVPKKSLKK